MNRHRDLFILRATIAYAIFALLWIFLSDNLLRAFTDIDALVWLSTAKGVFFVSATTIGLLFLLRGVPSGDGAVHDNLLDQLASGLLPGHRFRWVIYALAVLVTLAMIALRNAMAQQFGDRPAFILFMLPIVLSAMLGGLGPGLLATAIAALGVNYFALLPVGSFHVASDADILQWLFLVANGVAVSVLSEAMRRSREKSDTSRRLLEAVVNGTTDAVFVKDVSGRYVLANSATAKFLGKEVHEVLGKDDLALFPHASARALSDVDQAVMASGRTQSHEETLSMPGGGEKSFLVTKGPMLDDRGAPIGLFGISHDITERRIAENRLRESEAFSTAILDSTHSEIAVLDTEGVIVAVNQAWSQFALENPVLPGLPVRGVEVGSNYLEVIQSARGDSAEGAREAYDGIQAVLEGHLPIFSLEYPCHSPAEQRWFSMNVTPLRTAAGGAVVSHVTITKRKQVELALREAQSLAGIGNWSWQTGDEFPVWSDVLYEIYGRDRELGPIPYSDFSKHYTPESWARLSALVDRCLIDGTGYESDVEVLRPDGSLCWVIARGDCSVDRARGTARIHGTIQDITQRKQSEEIAYKALAQTRAFIAQSPVGIAMFDSKMNYLAASNLWTQEFGGGRPSLVGFNNRDIQPDLPAVWQAALQQGMSGASLRKEEDLWAQTDGSVRYLNWSVLPWSDERGEIGGVIVAAEDVTERKHAQEELRKLAQAVEQSPESIVITDLAGNIEYTNQAFVRNSGYSDRELKGHNSRILQSGKTPRASYESMWQALADARIWEGEFYNRRKDGSEYLEHAVVSPIRHENGTVTHYLAVKQDITEKRRNEAEIHRLAFYDTLTGLPNRVRLLENVERSLTAAHRSGNYNALMLFNIDRFKTINDARGHVYGDILLQQVAERLTAALRESDVVARNGSDEFGILLPDLASDRQVAANMALRVAEKIQLSLRRHFEQGDLGIALNASLGIALFPGSDGDLSLDVLRRATTALHHAKGRGGSQTAFFEDSLDQVAQQRFNTERELNHAIAAGELRVFLQSQVDASGRAVGAEALVRWQHPQRGLVPPGAFIPIAEETSLIIDIGKWVLTDVCHLLARESALAPQFRISVNVGPRHFRQADFVEQIRRILQSTGADPARLTLEVTEGMLIDNLSDVIAKMNELTALGIHFSLDDFGTGYSSLSYLKRLPIHELKIDKTFIQDLTTDRDDDSLVEAILAVAGHLHLKVVAEGVETAEQAAFLNERAQVIHQGYLFGRPEPVADWLAHNGDAVRRA